MSIIHDVITYVPANLAVIIVGEILTTHSFIISFIAYIHTQVKIESTRRLWLAAIKPFVWHSYKVSTEPSNYSIYRT